MKDFDMLLEIGSEVSVVDFMGVKRTGVISGISEDSVKPYQITFDSTDTSAKLDGKSYHMDAYSRQLTHVIKD